MRFYKTQHKDYGGIDLHARTLYVCILDQSGEVFVTAHSPDDDSNPPETIQRHLYPSTTIS